MSIFKVYQNKFFINFSKKGFLIDKTNQPIPNDLRFIEIKDAKLIKIKGFEEFEFFFFKRGQDYVITEAITGGKIAEGKSLKEALDLTKEKLNKQGKSKVKIFLIKKSKELKSPRYVDIG